MTDTPSHRRLAFAVIALLTLAVHGIDVTHQFTNWDDSMLLTENPLLNPVTAESLRQMWSGPVVRLYTPVAYTLWAMAMQVTHSPWLFHAINVLLHVGSALLVLAILLRLTGGRVIASAIGAAVFAVHPLQAEPVAWVAGMNNVLAGMLSLACVYFWLGRADKNVRPTDFWTLIGVVFFLLACLSKPTAIVTPLVILVIDLLILRRRPRWMVWVMVVLAVPFVLIGRNAQDVSLAPPLLQRIFVAGDALGFYLQKLAWPWPLYIDYGRTPEWVLAARPVGGWIAVAVAVIAASVTIKRWPWIAGSLGVFVAGVCLVLGLVSFDFQVYSTVADRYIYLSMLGPAILIAFLIAKAPKAACGFAVAIIVAMATMSIRQSLTWATTDTLVAQLSRYNPDSLAAHTILAALANSRNDPATAERHYRAILATHPADVNTNRLLADLLRERGQFAESLPYYQAAYDAGLRSPLLFNNWGLSLWQAGHHGAAAGMFEQALQLDAENFNAHLNLGQLLTNFGQLELAKQHLQRATELNPSSAIARDSLATVEAMRARTQNR